MKKKKLLMSLFIVAIALVALSENHIAVEYRDRLEACDVAFAEDCPEDQAFFSWNPWQESVATDTFKENIRTRELRQRDGSIYFVDGAMLFLAAGWLASIWRKGKT